MYKTVYALANYDIEKLAHQKRQKSRKLILFSSILTHSQC